VGSSVCRRLIGDPSMSVHAIVRPNTSNLWRLSSFSDFLRFYCVDLRDELEVKKTIKEIDPEIVYHFATYGGYPDQNDMKKIIETNITGTSNLLNSLLSMNNVELFANAGSVWQHPPGRKIDQFDRLGHYSDSKYVQDLLCKDFYSKFRLPTVTLKLSSVYGPHQSPVRLVSKIVNSSLTGENVTIVSPKIKRDFIYETDVVDACMMIESLRNNLGKTIDIGSGRLTTSREIVNIVEEITNKKVNCTWKYTHHHEEVSPIVSVLPGENFNWRPRVDLFTGLSNIIKEKVAKAI